MRVDELLRHVRDFWRAITTPRPGATLADQTFLVVMVSAITFFVVLVAAIVVMRSIDSISSASR